MSADEKTDKGYTLRLELWSAGEVVGEVEARFSDEAIRGLVRGVAVTRSGETRTGSAPAESVHSRTEPEHTNRQSPRPFRGRDDNPTQARGDERAMSTEQRKFLFRLAYGLGFKKDAAERKVLEVLGVERFEWATRSIASRGIDALKEEMAHRKGGNGVDDTRGTSNGRSNGHSHGAGHHG